MKIYNFRSFIVLVALLSTVGCSKFLDRDPLSQISPANAFNSEKQLALYVNSFYDQCLPNASNDDKGFYALYNEKADNIASFDVDDQITGNRKIPVSGGGWSWSSLRNINYFIQNCHNGNLDPKVVNKYLGVAKFFRAFFYFSMVTRFGDVPWYSTSIEANDSTLLLKARDPRTLVMDSVLSDINFAIANLGTDKNTAAVNKWTALAFKSRMCLYEGTFRKYHDELNLPGSTDFLKNAADAALQFINGSPYSLYMGSDPNKAYQELFTTASVSNSEYILTRSYLASASIYYSANYYTLSSTFGKPGFEKKLVDGYLMKDGSRFTDRTDFDKISFFEEMKNRDPRLSQSIRTPGYKRLGASAVSVPTFVSTVTGYQPIKFVSDASEDGNNSKFPLPIFRSAEVLLNYAEAMAELGSIQQSDIDISIGKLRTRAGMPNLNVAFANQNPDSFLAGQYSHVKGTNKGVLLEIRRERRNELVMEGFRWNDLMRWREGKLLTAQFKGIYFPGLGDYDLDGDGKPDINVYAGSKPTTTAGQVLKLGVDVVLENGNSGGMVLVNPSIKKTFDEGKDYFFPLPIQDLLLNPNLVQNSGWKK